jgi:glutathione S-transferase
MKLHWSPKSPYVRKVMLVAHETGLADRIELVRTPVLMAEVNPAIMGDNPLGKIPTLVLDDGRAVFDSLVICQYLARLADDRQLFPQDPDSHLDAMVRHALGAGVSDALIIWRNERNRPDGQRLEGMMSALPAKVGAALDVMEQDADRMASLPFDIGAAAIGATLAYMDFRFADVAWRGGRPRLAAWFEAFAARPSARATEVTDG